MVDSGYDCNYYHDKNHFAKDFMLRKMSEKKDDEDDQAYHMWKLEEIKKKKASNVSMNVLIVQEHVIDDEFVGVQVWSTDSKDEEVCRSSHGRDYVAREGVTESVGRCLMVTTERKHEEAKLKEEKSFVAKPMSKRISDCDQLI